MASWIFENLIFTLVLIVATNFVPGYTVVDVAINGITTDYIIIRNISDFVSLTCAAVNNTHDEELVWFRGDREINLKSKNRINVSTVCIDPITENDDEAKFSCHLNKNHKINTTVRLDIKFMPILNRDGDGQIDVYAGNNVKLQCNVKSNPPAAMSWHKDNSALKMVTGKHSVYWDSGVFTLSIKKVENTDNGTYVCVADSALGSNNLTFHLNVKDKPYVVPFEPIVAGLTVVLLTAFFGIFSRRKIIIQACKKKTNSNRYIEYDTQ
ncbi:transmembrane and immunoglobulin domain-containing protein 1 [Chiloscyllium plagiosum]|uniref:transmembrane and immunoglobulin domain-containing protein 1 n=1 Tax=Chiloscyllium plagiosum TaxID=36176 RepID=UPI001CB84286|nr:transmembrane and immunoglobulin domain-containing protein 1 [Chiloscyllium plagiosum]